MEKNTVAHNTSVRYWEVGGLRQVRAFVAVNFPSRVKAVLGEIISELKKYPAQARWVEAGGIHITLQFLGNIYSEQVPEVVAALKKCTGEVRPFNVSLSGAGVFPSPARPRVLWVGVEEGTGGLLALQQCVQASLAQLGFRPEEKRFVPHLTLARLKSGLGFPALVEKAAELVAGARGLSAPVNSVELMQSELTPRGARYSVLASVPLWGVPADLKAHLPGNVF